MLEAFLGKRSLKVFIFALCLLLLLFGSLALPLLLATETPEGTGYELFHNGKRVGHEPTWDFKAATSNFRWNVENHKKVKVEGFYNGKPLTYKETSDAEEADSGIGYELFYDGKRVGNSTQWDIPTSIANFRWNIENRPGIKVKGTYDGRDISYLKSVEVLPVFYVPAGEKGPSGMQMDKLNRHLQIARKRYFELLKGRDTFRISNKTPPVLRSCNNIVAVKNDLAKEALNIVAEVLEFLGHDRFDNPYVLLIVILNSHDENPPGGGRPINGGVNSGGGIVLVSSFVLDNSPSFQSTLQHELGHSFGLLHVDVAFLYDMGKSASIMSYNLSHHWNGFEPPAEQGILLPEEQKILSRNKLVFPGFWFDPAADIPDGYRMSEKALILGPMALPPEGVGSDGCWGK